MTITTTLTALPTAPDRADPNTFSARADAWVGALERWSAEINDLTTEINLTAETIDGNTAIIETLVNTAADNVVGQVADDLVAAEAAKQAAVAAANFKGDWSDLTGALSIPASVSHQGGVWLLLNDLADVTASEPSVTADWEVIQDSAIAPTSLRTTAVSVNAAVNERVYVTASGQTVILPLAGVATNGDIVSILVGDFTDTIVDRNVSTIMGLAEDMVIDKAFACIDFMFVSGDWRLV